MPPAIAQNSVTTTNELKSPSTNLAYGYGVEEYWNQRYKAEQRKYDWYLTYPEFKEEFYKILLKYMSDGSEPMNQSNINWAELIPPTTRKSIRILVVGCGNSELSVQLLNDGFEYVHSVDYSTIVIEKMNHLYSNEISHHPNFKFETQDVRQLPYRSGSYDLIIDKGTLDAILCGTDSSKHSSAMLIECRRLLNQSSTTSTTKLKSTIMIDITYGAPSTRLPYLTKSKLQWEKVDHLQIGENRHFYICETNKEMVQ